MLPIVLPAHIEPIDVWRSAKLMVQQHGDLAVIECAFKADEMLENNDLEGQRVWMAIRRAARYLLEHCDPPDVLDGPTN